MVREGDLVADTQVLCEVSTSELTEDPDDGTIVLEIETHEEVYIAKLMLAEGESSEPDFAIAVIVEDERDVAAFADFPLGRQVEVEPGTFAWQGFLKSGQAAPGGCS